MKLEQKQKMTQKKDEEIQILLEKYKHLKGIVNEQLHKLLTDKVPLILITHRIKTAESIMNKIE